MTAMTTSQAEFQRKQKELDSILDAALDELDDSDSEDDFDEDCHADQRNARNDVPQKQNAATADVDVDVDAPIGVDARIGVPYSREYLSNNPSVENRGLNNKNNNNNNALSSQNRPQFGPEPPPPSSSLSPPLFDTSQLPPLPPLDLPPGDAEELAASLEGMMKQFTEQLGGGFDGGGDGDFGGMAGLDDMFKKMMDAEGGIGSGDDASTNRVATTNGYEETPRDHSRNDDNTTSASTPSTSNNNQTKNKKTTPRKNNVPKTKEPNVDESINRLLDGINSATNQPLPSANLPNPTNNNNADDNINMDPSQFEKMGEQMMENIMSQFDTMGSSEDGNDVVDGVMKQLLNRELMYEPMKEVCTRFPAYLAKHKEELSEVEYTRYGMQYQYFQKIVHVYETEPENFDRLMELMQEVQEYGQPPVEIIRDLAPELEFDGEGMPVMNPMGGMGGIMGGMPGMPGMMPTGMGAFPGGAGGNEQCCIS